MTRDLHGRIAWNLAPRWTTLLVAVCLLGCATAPPESSPVVQIEGLSTLAGKWEWTSRLETPARLGPGPVAVRIEGGKILFESRDTSGTFTLHEGEGKRVLRGEGVSKAGGRPFSIELTQRK